MELIEIIVNALKIFTLASVILLILSYFFFKMKDRKRIKPYMLVDSEPDTYEVPEVKESADVLNYRKFSERFQVLNEEHPAPQFTTKNAFYRPSTSQIKPNNNIYNLPRTNSYHRNNSGNTPTNNIYNLYSPETSEPMHKLKINFK